MPHYQVRVGFYVEAESEEDALRKVEILRRRFGPIVDKTDEPEAWDVTPWDMEG